MESRTEMEITEFRQLFEDSNNNNSNILMDLIWRIIENIEARLLNCTRNLYLHIMARRQVIIKILFGSLYKEIKHFAYINIDFLSLEKKYGPFSHFFVILLVIFVY